MIVESVILSHGGVVLSSFAQVLKTERPNRPWLGLPLLWKRTQELFTATVVHRYLVCLAHVVEMRAGRPNMAKVGSLTYICKRHHQNTHAAQEWNGYLCISIVNILIKSTKGMLFGNLMMLFCNVEREYSHSHKQFHRKYIIERGQGSFCIALNTTVPPHTS